MARTFVITGAGSGIGHTTAELLRRRGDTVIGVELRGPDVWSDYDEAVGAKFARIMGLSLIHI